MVLVLLEELALRAVEAEAEVLAVLLEELALRAVEVELQSLMRLVWVMMGQLAAWEVGLLLLVETVGLQGSVAAIYEVSLVVATHC